MRVSGSGTRLVTATSERSRQQGSETIRKATQGRIGGFQPNSTTLWKAGTVAWYLLPRLPTERGNHVLQCSCPHFVIGHPTASILNSKLKLYVLMRIMLGHLTAISFSSLGVSLCCVWGYLYKKHIVRARILLWREQHTQRQEYGMPY